MITLDNAEHAFSIWIRQRATYAALAVIPEAISFSIITGVDPAIGLLASFTMSVVISAVDGRRYEAPR